MKRCAVFGIVGWWLCTAVMGAVQSPNVLLIVTDDQRPDTVAALGNAVIRTPHLDALVKRGSSFLQAYAGYPICYASRAEILTGCPAFRAFAQYPGPTINPSLKMIASTFQEAGYVTWYSGKWHNDKTPWQRGYSATRGLFSSGGSPKGYRQPERDERGNPITGYTGWTFKTDDRKVELDKGIGLQPTNSLHIAEGAIQAIRDTPARLPFFLHVNFAFPHDPRVWPADERHRYGLDQVPLPRNFAAIHPFDHGNFDGRDEQLLPKPREPHKVQAELAVYYSMISDVDTQIGRIVEMLRTSGRENTLIVVTSDQGLAMGSHGLLGKQNQYQHSIRSPLIMAGPGIPGGRRFESLVMLRDIFPTLCDLANIAIPETVEAKSLRPLLEGKTDQVRDFVVAAFTDTQRMIRDRRWKWIVYPQVQRSQLFDLEHDADEMHDVSQDAEYLPIREKLETQLRTWCREQGDPLSF